MLIAGCVIFGICVAQLIAALALGPKYIAPPVPRPAAATTGASHPTSSVVDDAPTSNVTLTPGT